MLAINSRKSSLMGGCEGEIAMISLSCLLDRHCGSGLSVLHSIAFALDPDNYWVEIVGQNPVDQTEGVKETDTGAYRMVSL